MRFQAVERVSSTDSERVLVVLEQQLRRRVGGDVEREGMRLVLSGLGPSPRTVNPWDRTVIDVRAEDGATLIDADVNFQASALVGPVGQEDIVRSKLMRILGATRQQLEEEQDWLETERQERMEASSQGSSTISSSSVRIYSGPQRVAGPRRTDDSSGQQALHREEPVVENEPEEKIAEPLATVVDESRAAAEELPLVEESKPVDAVVDITAADAVAVVEERAVPVVEVKDKALPEVKTSAAAAHEADNAAMAEQSKQEHLKEEQLKAQQAREELRAQMSQQSHQSHARNDVRSFSGAAFKKAEAEPNRPWVRWAAIAACVVAIVPFAWRLRPKTGVAAPVIDLTQSVSKTAAPVGDAGPEGALRQWEMALRSTDANAQTAYYSVPVEQYMWKHNVNRRDLQTMKEQEIARRRGLWTVKFEDVDIKRNDGTATVTLVKHTMEQPQGGGKVRERFVHTQLVLKNSLGIWWITSERDLYPKKVSTDDEDNFDPNEGETPSWAKPAPASVAAGATPSGPSTN